MCEGTRFRGSIENPSPLPPHVVYPPPPQEKGKNASSFAVMVDGKKIPLRMIFKGTPFIPPAMPGKGGQTQPRKGSIASEILPVNHTKLGHLAGVMSFGVQEKSWCDAQEYTLWISESWKPLPNNGSILKQRPNILVLDNFKCHRDKDFTADLKRRANTIIIFHSRWVDSSPPTAGSHAQQADEAADAGQVHHLHRVGDRRPQDGQAKTAGAWGRVHVVQGVMGSHYPRDGQDLLQDLWPTLALDGSEAHNWYTHNFGEGYREILQQQRVEWEAAHLDVTLPPLQLPEVPAASGTNPITAAQKELEAELLPPSGDGESDSVVELVEGDGDVELVDGPGGGGVEGEEEVEP